MSTYLTDTFTGTNGTALTAHTSDSGASYLAGNGSGVANITLDGNGQIFNSSGTTSFAYANATMPSTQNVQVIFSITKYTILHSGYTNYETIVLLDQGPDSSPTNTYSLSHLDNWGFEFCTNYVSRFGPQGDDSWFTNLPPGTPGWCKVVVQSVGGTSIFTLYKSTTGDTGPWTQILTTSITTPSSSPANVGYYFQGLAQTATTGFHIGDIQVSDPPPPTPSCQLSSAYVSSSGGCVGLQFTASGTSVNPTGMGTAPTVYQNGVSVGTITTCWTPGYTAALLLMPAGVLLKSTDTVTITTVDNWMACSGPNFAAGQTNFPVSTAKAPSPSGGYYKYHSNFGSDTIARTLKPGFNISTTLMNGQTGNVFANLRLGMQADMNSGNGWTKDGYPTTIVSSPYTEIIISDSYANNLDSTGYPEPTGYFALGYDDLAYATSPTTLAIVTGDSSVCTVTQIHTCDNPGSGGVGQFYLFNVQRVGGSTTAHAPISLQWTNAAKAPQVANLFILGPGDFNVPSLSNTSWSFPRTNPLQFTNQFLQAMANGVGTLRGPSEVQNQSNVSEPWEQRGGINDFCWAIPNSRWHNSTANPLCQYQSIQPFTAALYPWIYGDAASLPNGSSWTPMTPGSVAVTLGASITDAPAVGTMENITLSATPQAADQPFYGLVITIGSEQLKVFSFDGNVTVNVMRGAEGTTPATHSAGAAITIGSRIATGTLAQYGGQNTQVFVMVTVNPHGIKTGQNLYLVGNYPTLTMTDGTQVLSGNLTSSARYCFVTGANSFWTWTPMASSACVTLPAGVNLSTPYSQYYTTYQEPEQGLPWAATAYMCAQFPGCTMHVGLPMLGSDSYVYRVANQIFSQWPVGQTILLELGDEPWNPFQNQQTQDTFIGRINGGAFNPGSYAIGYYYYHIWRSQRCKQIFQTVWGSRSSEIKLGLNVQFTGPSYSYLQLCIDVGVNLDFVLVAPYIDTPNDGNTETVNTIATIEQNVDIWTHSMNLSPGPYDGAIAAYSSQWQAQINTYNAATGSSVTLRGYEGGYQTGVYFANHNAPTYFQTAMTRDMQYDPVYYVAMWDFYALLQGSGYTGFALNTYTFPANYANAWGTYQCMTQIPGYGDGSDGKANNRLARATTGLSGPFDYTKTTALPVYGNQDANSVSVRMQAFIDWMASQASTPVAAVQASPAAIVFGI
jgi:hypothetical protein